MSPMIKTKNLFYVIFFRRLSWTKLLYEYLSSNICCKIKKPVIFSSPRNYDTYFRKFIKISLETDEIFDCYRTYLFLNHCMTHIIWAIWYDFYRLWWFSSLFNTSSFVWRYLKNFLQGVIYFHWLIKLHLVYRLCFRL